MRSKFVIPFLLFLFVGQSSGQTIQDAKEEPILLTVCEALGQRLEYNGKSVAIVGVLLSTFEGVWLSDKGCGNAITSAGFAWPNYIVLILSRDAAPDPSKMSLIDEADLNRKLELVKGRNELRQFRGSPNASGGVPDYSDRLVVVYGRFETRPELRPPKRKDGKGDWGNGYGHMNASPAQLEINKEGSIRYF